MLPVIPPQLHQKMSEDEFYALGKASLTERFASFWQKMLGRLWIEKEPDRVNSRASDHEPDTQEFFVTAMR